MDDRRFDDLSRRIGALALPRLPRRGVMGLLGGATLAGALGLVADPQLAEAAKCKKEGKKCDKKKCKKKDKKCCCKDLKCKQGRCKSKGPTCPTETEFDDDWGGTGSDEGDFNDPWGITTDPDGNVYVTDTGNNRVQVFNQNGVFQDEWGTQGTGQTQFQEVLGIAINQNNNGVNRVFATDPGQTNGDRKLRRFDDDGTFRNDLGLEDELEDPAGAAVDTDGNLWVVDDDDGEIFLFDEVGDFITSWTPTGNGDLNSPQGIAVFEDEDDDATYVFVTDTLNNRVVKFEYVNNNPNGLQFVDSAGSGGSGNSNFNQPTGIAVDECGNLWVADRLNNRIQQLDKNLNFESRFSDSLNRPTGLTISPNGNSLYVVNNVGDIVSKFDLVD